MNTNITTNFTDYTQPERTLDSWGVNVHEFKNQQYPSPLQSRAVSWSGGFLNMTCCSTPTSWLDLQWPPTVFLEQSAVLCNCNGKDPLFLFKRKWAKAKEKGQKHGPAFAHSFFFGSIKSETKANVTPSCAN